MALAISLTFDVETAGHVRDVWETLAEAGTSNDMLTLGYPPHLTLVVADDDAAEGAMRAALASAKSSRLSVQLREVSQFAGTSVVFVACNGGDDLLSLHQSIAQSLPLEAIRPHYRPGQWTPHVTVQTVGDGSAALALARSVWRWPAAATCMRLELARFLPVEVIESVAL